MGDVCSSTAKARAGDKVKHLPMDKQLAALVRLQSRSLSLVHFRADAAKGDAIPEIKSLRPKAGIRAWLACEMKRENARMLACCRSRRSPVRLEESRERWPDHRRTERARDLRD